MGDLIFKVIGYGAALYAVAALFQYVIFPINQSRCEARWSPSGFQATWNMNGGCTVNVDGLGRWVPEANVQISLPSRK